MKMTLIEVCAHWKCNPQDVFFTDGIWHLSGTTKTVPAVDNRTELALDVGEYEGHTIYTCTDCGAHAFISAKDIIHHNTCRPGESDFWKKFYDEAENDTP